MPKPLTKRPGWLFIERYMPDATPEQQEEAFENLRGLVRILVGIDDRLSKEEVQAAIGNRTGSIPVQISQGKEAPAGNYDSESAR